VNPACIDWPRAAAYTCLVVVPRGPMETSPVIASLETLRKEIEAYSAANPDESWMKDHQDAMACFDLEEHIGLGIGLYENIVGMQSRWQEAVSSKRVSANSSIDRALDQLVWLWAQPCPDVEKRIRHFELEGDAVKQADRFRKCWDEANSRLIASTGTWRGHRIRHHSELEYVEFPYPPEPE